LIGRHARCAAALQILAASLALCGDSLFIPIAGGLTLPFKCETTWSHLNIKCFSGMHLAAVFASAVLLSLLIVIAVTGACCALGLVILRGLAFCDNSMREKDWRCRKRGTQAT
jgi:hypothetical protein